MDANYCLQHKVSSSPDFVGVDPEKASLRFRRAVQLNDVHRLDLSLAKE